MKKILAILYILCFTGLFSIFLFVKDIDKNLNINGIKFVVNMLDKGGWVYKQHPDEVVSKFYKLMTDEYYPDIVIDIGANYGFISLITAQYLPCAEFIAVEPNLKVTPYLKRNFEMNNINGVIWECVAGDKRTTGDFYINPRSSQDSRVTGKKGWKKQPVGKVLIDSLLAGDYEKTVFIKSDTQGYEEYVFLGGLDFLTTNNKWIMRMEFCPALLEFNGTDASKFLSFLVNNFDVTDIGQVPYNTKSISSLFENKLTESDVDDYIQYVNKLKRNNVGWTDILIKPKT